MKMIKQLDGFPGIKWKSSTEPMLKLKENPNSGASTSRSLTWRRSKTKRFYKTFSKKSSNPNKCNKLKEKRTILQKIINNLEDYRQPVRRPITLADFMSELQIDPSEVENDEQENKELLHVETCRVISVALITDDNSEEELCFSSDDELDQQIASQMEHAKLNEDSEHTTKTLSDEAESNEVDQVQLRSAVMLAILYLSNLQVALFCTTVLSYTVMLLHASLRNLAPSKHSLGTDQHRRTYQKKINLPSK
ncbi:hypothetical protein M5K25_026734 [Dendrobium thyrsiflorum]|uniref:Uncharacterized protein n=1 Tax=Dendrobium thyrsiflorum TaxID=117978 RepID=A0ABD0TY33_DENTH